MTPTSPTAARAGALVREHRESLGLTQRELAALAGFPGASYIAKLEQGRGVTLENLAAVARGLDMPLKDLVP